jgi:hypothetical protein
MPKKRPQKKQEPQPEPLILVEEEFFYTALILANHGAKGAKDDDEDDEDDDDNEVNTEYFIELLVYTLFNVETLGDMFVEKALFNILAALYGATSSVTILYSEVRNWKFRSCTIEPCLSQCGICVACENFMSESHLAVGDWDTFEQEYKIAYSNAYRCKGRYHKFSGKPCSNIAVDGYLYCDSCVKNTDYMVCLMNKNTYQVEIFVPLNRQNILRPPAPWIPILPPCKPQD